MDECLSPYDEKEDADIFETSPPVANICRQCGEESDNPPRYFELTPRCKKCTTTAQRIHLALRHDKQLRNYWRLSPNKRSIVASAKHAYKDALWQMLVSRLVGERTRAGLIANGTGNSNGKKKTSIVNGTGNSSDETALHYKCKWLQERIAAIDDEINNLSRCEPFVTKMPRKIYSKLKRLQERIVFIHDQMKYLSAHEAEVTKTPSKKRKFEAWLTEGVATTTSEQPLTEDQIRHVDKMCVQLAALFEKACESHDQIRKSTEEKGWAEHLPPYIQPQLQAILVTMESKNASQDWLNMTTLISAAIGVLRRASFQIATAKSVMDKKKANTCESDGREGIRH